MEMFVDQEARPLCRLRIMGMGVDRLGIAGADPFEIDGNPELAKQIALGIVGTDPNGRVQARSHRCAGWMFPVTANAPSAIGSRPMASSSRVPVQVFHWVIASSTPG